MRSTRISRIIGMCSVRLELGQALAQLQDKFKVEMFHLAISLLVVLGGRDTAHPEIAANRHRKPCHKLRAFVDQLLKCSTVTCRPALKNIVSYISGVCL